MARDKFVTFEVGPTREVTTADGTTGQVSIEFRSTTNTAIFKDSDAIGMGNVAEELIHSMQRIVYGEAMTNKDVNFELEAKIIRDVISGNAEAMYFGKEGNTLVADDYGAFKLDVGEEMVIQDSVVSKYQEIYENWSNPNYPRTETINNQFDPKLLKIFAAVCEQTK